jgi:hypothetical protein
LRLKSKEIAALAKVMAFVVFCTGYYLILMSEVQPEYIVVGEMPEHVAQYVEVSFS